MAKHLLYYKSEVSITDVDENKTYTGCFDEIYENDWYFVIDKQNMGENLGAEIIENLNKKEIFDGDDFSEDFKDEILTMVEEEVTNTLRDGISEYVLDYLGNNL